MFRHVVVPFRERPGHQVKCCTRDGADDDISWPAEYLLRYQHCLVLVTKLYLLKGDESLSIARPTESESWTSIASNYVGDKIAS